MQVPINGGPPKLDKAEVRRMTEGVYLARRLARELTNAAEQKEVTDAAEVYLRIIRKFGGHHLNADGTVKEKESRKRDESEAKGSVAP